MGTSISGLGPDMHTATAGTSAASVTVAETLTLLDGLHEPVAKAIADGRYVFWLGSGVSRGRVDGLDGIIERLLVFLQEKAAAEGPSSPHGAALEAAIRLADLRADELARTDLSKPVSSWPDLSAVINGLVGRYSELLDISVEGQPNDYLLWDGVDVRKVYPRGAQPDAEHLAITVLVLEGVLGEVASANWDGLIEAAIVELAPPTSVAQIVVLQQDLQESPGIVRLIKFHGCAVLAADDPDTYRDALVARASQVAAWAEANETAAICGELVSLATTKPTLMIGLSAQDSNIKTVFSRAKARMRWPWPSNPPAHVFTGDRLGQDHLTILKMVYRDDYEGNGTAIEAASLIRAYGSQLLTALVLKVTTSKFFAYLESVTAPSLQPSSVAALKTGLRQLRDLAATQAEGDRVQFMRDLVEKQTRALMLFRSGKEPGAGHGSYQPISDRPVVRIPSDPGLETSGMRELAVGLGLLGRQMAAKGWTIDFDQTSCGHHGALRVVTPGGRESAVFFAANPRAGVELEVSGIAAAHAENLVVVYSSGPVERLSRSPHGHFGRTGSSGARHVHLSGLLDEATDLSDLERRFCQEAAL